MSGLSFVWPLAYDWRRGCEAIARLWDLGEEHVIALDRLGETWAGGLYEPPEIDDLYAELGRNGIPNGSVGGSARFVFGDFSPRWGAYDRQRLFRVEMAERNALSFLCRPGNWSVSVDADEEWCNPEETRPWFLFRDASACGVSATSLMVYKVIDDTALVLGRTFGKLVAVGAPGIWTNPGGVRHPVIASPLRFVNWWLAARARGELRLKLASMEYAVDHNREVILDEWEACTLDNFHTFRGFGSYTSPLVPMAVSDLRAGRWAAIGGRK